MSRLAGPLSVIAVVAFAILFAARNGTERVTLDLGILVLYGVPVTVVAFGGLLVGMLVMLAAGIRSDLKVRAILRQRLADESEEEGDLVDTGQRDLFLHSPPRERVTPEPPGEEARPAPSRGEPMD